MTLTLAAMPLTSPDRLSEVLQVVIFCLGLVLLTIGLLDLVLATLSGRGRFGVYSGAACKELWRMLRLIAKRSPAHRDAILDAAGPLMLVMVVTLWVLLPTVGFGLMILPGLDGGFVTGGGAAIPPPSRHVVTAIYISGFGFTTLGAGPFVPQTNGYRLLLVTQAAIGFATFTLAITYLLSVLSALRRRNSFARQVHHLTGGSDDALDLLGRVTADRGLRREVLLELARGLHDVHESHLAYPVLHYFRHGQPHFSMGTLATVSADLVSLARAAAPGDSSWHRDADAEVARGAAVHLLRDLASRFLDDVPDTAPAIDASDRMRRAADLLDVDEDEGSARRYEAQRSDWVRFADGFRRDMLFPNH